MKYKSTHEALTAERKSKKNIKSLLLGSNSCFNSIA